MTNLMPPASMFNFVQWLFKFVASKKRLRELR